MDEIKPVAWYDSVSGKVCFGTKPTDQYLDHPSSQWKPLYDSAALAQAEEKGRLKGLREAAKLLENSWLRTQADCIEAITRAAEGKS